MTITATPYSDLDKDTLYDILRLRSEVFLLEQHIVCQDMDGVDRNAIHVHMKDNGRVTGYLRVFKDGISVRIGRVAVAREHRGENFGAALMQTGIETARKDLWKRVSPTLRWSTSNSLSRKGQSRNISGKTGDGYSVIGHRNVLGGGGLLTGNQELACLHTAAAVDHKVIGRKVRREIIVTYIVNDQFLPEPTAEQSRYLHCADIFRSRHVGAGFGDKDPRIL